MASMSKPELAPLHRSGAVTDVPAIELRGATKIFVTDSGARIVAVDNVTVSIPKGQFTCVLGPSGHGKTTLLNLIAGFVEPSTGAVIVDGKPVKGPGPDRGVVFQQDTLFLWKKVAGNIGYGPKCRRVPRDERKRIVQKYARLVGLERFLGAWPKELSGGMRRRVAIAAVFANDPAVLLMDEPFAAIDYVRRADLHRVLLDLWRESNRTVFFVTHDIDEALALADRILVVVSGTLADDIELELERPRTAATLSSPRASEIRLRILEHMGLPRNGEINL
jgi:NitT/TauT family transport system ATP-binding protein